MSTTYDDSSITTMDGLDHIRLRVPTYIPDVGLQGQFHVFKEIADNAVDEAELKGKDGLVELYLFKDASVNNYQVVVVDNGRGVPHKKMIPSFTVVNTSGKFSQKSYRFSVGLNGVGSKVVCATSKIFRVISAVGNKLADTKVFDYKSIPKMYTNTINHTDRQGTVVMFSPDNTIFREINDFIGDQSAIIRYISQLSLFADYRIKLYVFDDVIDEVTINSDTGEFIKWLESLQAYHPVFDSEKFDRDEYVRSFYDLMHRFNMSDRFQYAAKAGDMILDLQLDVMLTSNIRNNILTFVNNIVFTNKTSFQYEYLMAYIKKQIFPLIENMAIATYFRDNYSLPIWLLANIKYSGATFAGMEKHSFRDLNFGGRYKRALKEMISSGYISKLYTLLTEHIQAGYDRFSNRGLKVSNGKSLLTQLNRPTKFTDCESVDRSFTELFLIEGDSAKSNTNRKPKFQASYTLSGKPLNSIKTMQNLGNSRDLLKRNPIFQDIIKIVGIHDGSLDNLYFDKVFLTTDADVHGQHIANIVIGNLYAICPELLRQGHVYVVMPPHYKITLKGGGRLFARNSIELTTVLAKFIYYNYLEIRMVSDRYDSVLTKEEFIAFAEIIERVGDTITSVANEHFIHPVILEQLALLSNRMDFENPDTDMLSKWFGIPVRFHKVTKLLTLSIGTEDIVVPTKRLLGIIHKYILPLYKEFYYNRIQLFLTTKKADIYNNTPITIVQIFEIFKQLQTLLTISPLKGLGTMDGKDRQVTCIAPETRRSYQITSVGNIDRIFELLGTDSQYRKKLVLSSYLPSDIG